MDEDEGAGYIAALADRQTAAEWTLLTLGLAAVCVWIGAIAMMVTRS